MGITSIIKLPFTDAVGIFTTLFIIILLLPPIFRKFKIPGIIGLIFAGIIVGPYALNLLSKEIGFNVLGSFGLLYLMFLVGLEINLDDFLQHKKKALLFGILSFFIPFILGSISALLIFKLDNLAIVGIATMLGTHTLVSYPIISKYGLKNHVSVTLVIGATIIADTLALVFVGLIGDLSLGNFSIIFLLDILIRYSILFLITLFILPIICKWFFKHYEGETTYGFVFTLAMAMISAFISELLKIEPIIGTFFAGLAINRYIGRTSPLMNKISFIGETLFIPLFLIGVGILINPFAFTSSLWVWGLVGVLFLTYIAGKYLAAAIIQKQMKLDINYRNLIAGLSSSKAAAAIAIAILIFKSGLMDETIINITVLLILFTSLYSTYLTDFSAKKIVLNALSPFHAENEKSDRMLVSISNPKTMRKLIKFSSIINNANNENPLYILSVSKDMLEAAKNRLVQEHILMEEEIKNINPQNKTELISRVESNISEGIANAASELLTNKIVIGWNIQKSAIQYFFGNLMRNLLSKTEKTVMVVKLIDDIIFCNRIIVIAPPKFEYEKSFPKTLHSIKTIATKLNCELHIYYHNLSEKALNTELSNNDFKGIVNLVPFNEFKRVYELNLPIKTNDLILAIKARKFSLSYHRLMDNYPHDISELYPNNNCILWYPEQEQEEPSSIIY